MTLLLASSSPYRKQLLERLQLPFQCATPAIDESAPQTESPKATALRLAIDKAQALKNDYPNALIIGSDQVASLHQNPLGKPHTHHNAVRQLIACSGQAVTFHTGLCLLNTQTQQQHTACVDFTVHFRKLSIAEIKRYLTIEQPLDCAGSFKYEGLGITLFKRLEGDDPTSLIGLPLITLTTFLRQEGLSPLLSSI